MSGRKFWYLLTLLVAAMLPLAGCGGSGGTSGVSKDGYKVTVSGNVGASKSALKSLLATGAGLGTITVVNAQDGAVLATGSIDAAGKFSDLAITLPAAKSVLVFKAEVSLAGSPFRTIVPIDLSNPPAAGISASNSVSISISQESTDMSSAVSALLGLTGLLGDGDATLASAGKSYTDAAREVVNSGGKILAYNTSGLALNGSLANGSLLPVKHASSFSFSELNETVVSAKILSAYIPGKKPIVNFQVTNKATGKGISGLRTFGLHVARLAPEASGSSSYWVNYIDKGIAVPAGSGTGATAAGKPSADPGNSFNVDGSVKVKGYTVIDHGDGTYTAIFASDITSNANAPYDASALHRIGVTVTTVATPGVTATGPINPATGTASPTFQAIYRPAVVYDFIPATGLMVADAEGKPVYARDIISKEACDSCHYNLASMSGHFARWNPRLCVMCHTPTNTSGEGDFVTLIHRAHMGMDLPAPVQPENVVNPSKTGARTATLLHYDEMKFPQDMRNCTVCHKGADLDNWKSKPTRKNCGSCHNATDFTAHKGGQPSDLACIGCHGAGGMMEVSAAHTTNYATPNNPDVPAGAANFAYEIKTVTVNASNKAEVSFRIKKDGAAVTFQPFVAGATAPLTGFTGSPAFYIAFAQPQDGRTAPVEYNNTVKRIRAQNVSITNLWNGTQGTLTGPDAEGYYQAVIAGNSTTADTNFPVGATMRTVTLGGSFTQAPFGARKAKPAIKTVAGDAVRRVVVDQAKCNKCHEWLEAHGGGRNDVQFCVQCHNTTNSGFNYGRNSGLVAGVDDSESGSMANMIHRIHRGVARKTALTFHDTSALKDDMPQKVVYPGMLKNCESCHLPGTYDYTAKQYASLDNFLLTTTQQAVDDNNTGTATAGNPGPFGSVANPSGLNKWGFVQYTYGSDNNRVNSVITASCVGCHDSVPAKGHMKTNGGVVNGTRTEGKAAVEQCLVCHGTAANPLNGTVPGIKAVHRWW